MKIAQSAASLYGSRAFASYTSMQRTSVERQAEAAPRVSNSVAAIYQNAQSSMVSATPPVQEGQGAERRGRPAEEERQPAAAILSPAGASPLRQEVEDLENLKARLLERLLEILRGEFRHTSLLRTGDRRPFLDLRRASSQAAGRMARLFEAGRAPLGAEGLTAGTTAGGTVWKRITAVSGVHTESEHTAFQSQGYAVTEDGRSIRLDVEFSLSRSFSAEYSSFSSQSVLLTDPLIINLEGGAASVTDAKFQFDLDCDGQEESVSFAGPGSGFLALDKNGNGLIDDGGELFGAQSGDGFGDLAAYDSDGNRWIDENDAVYENLRVWTRDADGNDALLTLREANVGAIYLGSVDTEFTLHSADDSGVNGVIRRTGLYLKETGEAGTLSHVDLRC